MSTREAEVAIAVKACHDWASAEPEYEDVWVLSDADLDGQRSKAPYQVKDKSIRSTDGTYLNMWRTFDDKDEKTNLGIILKDGKYFREWMVLKCPDYADDYYPGTGRIFNIQWVELSLEWLEFSLKYCPTGADRPQDGQSSSSVSHTAVMGGNTITIQQNVSINRGGRDDDQEEPEEERPDDPELRFTTGTRRRIPDDNLLRLPTGGLVVGFSINLSARDAGDREAWIYPRFPDQMKIMHLNQRCGGMIDAQVHYIPAELAHMIRWCKTCAQSGRNVRMPSYCPCCDMNLNQPHNTSDSVVDMERYVSHAASCLYDQHSGLPATINPTSPCHRDRQDAILRECEEYAEKQHERKQAGYAPRMTTHLWAKYMLGRLPIWMNKFPNLG